MTLAEEMYQLTQEGIRQMQIEQAKKDDEFWTTLNRAIRAAAIKGQCSIQYLDLNFTIRDRLAKHGFRVKSNGQQSYEICWNPQA